MPIVLSQRIDKDSDYDDVPFVLYHYPKRYRNQIHTGDIFVYYQGDRYKKENRYYFGFGVVGKIESSEDGESYYAEILEGRPFPQKVPIYNPAGGFYESINYGEVRNSINPSWQNSVRKISEEAFREILKAANVGSPRLFIDMSAIESQNDPIRALNELNAKYQNYSPAKREKLINSHIDRGKSVTDALKKILGPQCQICDQIGFEKKAGDRYIEAHHLTQLALRQQNSLCSENVILVCPNCHREIHHGKIIEVDDRGKQIFLRLGNRERLIYKNSIEHLSNLSANS